MWILHQQLLRNLQALIGSLMVVKDSQLELILILYNNPQRAEYALQAVRQLEKSGELKLVDAAVIVKDLQGEAHFHELHDLETWRGTLFGAVAGALVGLLGGPVGALVGGVVGATAGGAVAGGIDLGFSNKFLEELKLNLRPGYSALLAIVEPPWDVAFVKALEPYMGLIYRHLLKSDVVRALSGIQDPEK